MPGDIKFLLDENMPRPVAIGLRRRGVDAVTVQEIGRAGLPDPDQLVFAYQQGRVLATLDTDYLILHSSGAPHAGVAYARPSRRSIGHLTDALMLIYEVLEPNDILGHVEYL